MPLDLDWPFEIQLRQFRGHEDREVQGACTKLGPELVPEVKAQPVWNASGTEDIALQNIQASGIERASKS